MGLYKKANKKRRQIDKIKFSIGTKLALITILIVVLSLGVFYYMASKLVENEQERMANDKNFEMNERAAVEAEDVLANIRAASGQLMHEINVVGINSDAALEAVEFFFLQNPRAVAFAYMFGGMQRVFVNRIFFLSRDIDPFLVEAYFNDNKTALLRATTGETVVLNASPVFTMASLALFFPYQGSGGQNEASCVLFDSEKLIDSFGSGTNQSLMINDQGDILVYSDFDMLQNGKNVASLNFIRKIYEDTKSHVQMDNTEFSFDPNTPPKSSYMAFTKLTTGGCIVITIIEKDKAFEGIAATQQNTIIIGLVVSFASFMFIWLFSKTFSTPIKTLMNAARGIEGGQFDQDITLKKSRDEIGMLGMSFQKMSSALRIFGRFTNREIAIKAMRGEIKPGGLPKHATIFFSDIRGFTALSENFTKTFGNEASDKIVFWLNDYLARMVECVEKTGGVVDKFIGDAVMAHWGTAYTSGNPKEDAFNCIKAALMMRHALLALNKEHGENDPGNPRIQIGCGINTGMVTAGQIGSDLRMEYTVIGDPVNVASRTEQVTKSFATDILITEDTWKLVGNQFITEEMPSIKAKGKTELLRIFAVVNFAKAETGPRTLEDVRKMLGFETPDLSRFDPDEEEEKYKIYGKRNNPNGV